MNSQARLHTIVHPAYVNPNWYVVPNPFNTYLQFNIRT